MTQPLQAAAAVVIGPITMKVSGTRMSTCKLAVVALLCVDADKVDVERTAFAEYALYLIALVLAEKSVVYEYAGELLADCLGKECCEY